MRSLKVGILFILLTQLFACGSRLVGWRDGDQTPPTVVSTIPAYGAMNVAYNADVTATFSEEMDPATISTTTFTLFDGTTAITGSVSYVGLTATFTPSTDLAMETVYTATITNAVTDLAGNAMLLDYVWTFTTGSLADLTPPEVIFTNPADDATDVAYDVLITATFSEAMAPLTISTTTFTVMEGANPVTGSVSTVGSVAAFTPDSDLDPNTLYTVTITTGVTDLAGNAMLANYVWTFTTGTDADLIPPEVISTTPLDLESNVAPNAPITATFSEAMDPLTISTLTFTVMDGILPVAGEVMYSGLTAIFTPLQVLDEDTLYTATITNAVADLAGNTMLLDYVWTFTTGEDEILPLVISTTPLNLASDVELNAPITATFSEAMDPLTISTLSFTVTDGAFPVVGTVMYSGLTATFTPLQLLDEDTLYTATITNAVTDLAGNAMLANYVWTFTTRADDIRPEVISTTPLNLAIDVAPNAPITATFSELMDPLTISTATFTVRDGFTPVAGTVMYSGLTATFTPLQLLDEGTLYTATITNAVTDLTGYSMLVDYVWTFTTVLDETPPFVMSTTPFDLETDVPLNTVVTATFSEEMNPLTIDDVSFTVEAGGVPVPGSVVYVGFTAIFTPTNGLDEDTVYTATIVNTVEDLAGTAMLLDYVWTFTTIAVPFNPFPLGLAEPFAIAATAGITNTPLTPITHINGDVVLDPNFTCNAVPVDNAGGFGLCGGSPPTINGIVITNTYPDTTTSAAVKADLNAAFLSITPPAGPPAVGSLPGGIAIAAPTTLGNVTGSPLVLGDNWFPPGVYISITSILITGDITLDGQGDPNALFVFQSASTLTTEDGAPLIFTRILLINGAKASNVWWQVGSSATIGTYSEFNGNILAAFDITLKTHATSCGRLMAGAWVGGSGAFVFDSNVVSVPGNGCPP